MQRDCHHTPIPLNWLSACTARHNALRCLQFSFGSQEDLICGIWSRLMDSCSATRIVLQARECLICHNMKSATLLPHRNLAEQHSGRLKHRSAEYNPVQSNGSPIFERGVYLSNRCCLRVLF